MKDFFLGPLLHWVLIAIIVGLGWLAGAERMHVIEFNTFIIAVLVVTILAILAVLKTSAPGKRVTRDPLDDDAPYTGLSAESTKRTPKAR